MTPKTDARAFRPTGFGKSNQDFVEGDFARSLETRCQVLEEALRKCVEWSKETRRDYAMTALVEINNITQAALKEGK